MATCSAIIAYNDGDSGLIDVIKKIGLTLGMFTIQGYRKVDEDRITLSAKKKCSEVGKIVRRRRRAFARGWTDREKDNEGGESYLSGGFM